MHIQYMYTYILCIRMHIYIYIMYTYIGWVVSYTGAAAVVACDKEAWDRG